MTSDSTMTALVARGGRQLTDPDAFAPSTVPVPALRPRDLLVRIRAVSINPVDTKIRSGLRAGGSRILGWDAAGTVEAVGSDVRSFSVGDDVWYAGDISRDGTNADLHAVDERIVAVKPRSLDFAEAAALPLTALTAWETLFDHLGLRPDSTGTLLVIGGAGGVGSILIQLAKALTGVRVIATASRERSAEWVRGLGADAVVDHRALAAEVGAMAPDGVEFVFTAHSRGTVEALARIVKPFGHIVAIDDPNGLDLLPLKRKSISWHWELMFTRTLFGTPDLGAQGTILAQLAELVDAGRIRSTLTTSIDGLNPEGLARAHTLVGAGSAIGKVVVHE
jgi:NADPH2:quinone reductase